MEKKYKDITSEYQKKMEQYLSSCFVYPQEPQQSLFSAMRYSLLAGGKRIRPILVFEFCRMSHCETEKAYPFAAAVEMIHTYSLIHDDLPCMDDDDFRRGNPTNHKVYGEAVAVLAGDALLTAAFSQIANSHLPAENRIAAVSILSEEAGALGMVGGQVLDMECETRKCTAEDVMSIQSRKTGALIRAACLLGLAAGDNLSDVYRKAAVDFADHLGIAFQIRDDMLDVIGNAEKLGKSVGTDTNKNTFVQLYGIEKCGELVKQHTDAAIRALEVFDDPSYLIWLTKSMINREA